MTARLKAYGLEVTVQPRWDGQIRRSEDAAGPVVHVANFALPVQRGDYGSGAVEVMASPHVLVCLLEHDAADVDQPLFARTGLPTIRPNLFSPSQMQRTIPGMAGMQHFFQEQGRAFCLYAVIGSYAGRGHLAREIDAVVRSIRISADDGQAR